MTTTALDGHTPRRAGRDPMIVAGIILGVGFGAFFDGFMLHQVLQWHNLVSCMVPNDTLEGLRINTFWDGVFHASAYAFLVIGVALLWRAVRRATGPVSGRRVFGAVLVGAALFNITDSVVNHWLLGLHHIRPGPDYLLYDWAFFIGSVALLLVGAVLVRVRGAAFTQT